MKCKEDIKYYRNITKERKIFYSLVIREGQDALELWFYLYTSQKFIHQNEDVNIFWIAERGSVWVWSQAGMLNFRSGPVRPYFSILMRIHENNEKWGMAGPDVFLRQLNKAL